MTEAGWYPDSAGSARLRYWDGAAWTGDHRPLPPPPGPGATVSPLPSWLREPGSAPSSAAAVDATAAPAPSALLPEPWRAGDSPWPADPARPVATGPVLTADSGGRRELTSGILSVLREGPGLWHAVTGLGTGLAFVAVGVLAAAVDTGTAPPWYVAPGAVAVGVVVLLTSAVQIVRRAWSFWR